MTLHNSHKIRLPTGQAIKYFYSKFYTVKLNCTFSLYYIPSKSSRRITLITQRSVPWEPSPSIHISPASFQKQCLRLESNLTSWKLWKSHLRTHSRMDLIRIFFFICLGSLSLQITYFHFRVAFRVESFLV